MIQNVNKSKNVKQFTSSEDLIDAVGDKPETITDYILIPAKNTYHEILELLVTDPHEGFHILQLEDKDYTLHCKDLKEICEDGDEECPPFGKVIKFALNTDKKMLAIYQDTQFTTDCEDDLIILKTNLQREENRLNTELRDITNILWVNTSIVLYTKKDIWVVTYSGAQEAIKLSGDSKNVTCMKEVDGLRIVNNDYVFFLEKIEDHVINTFDKQKELREEDDYDDDDNEDEDIDGDEASTMLLEAIRYLDFGIPKADSITD